MVAFAVTLITATLVMWSLVADVPLLTPGDDLGAIIIASIEKAGLAPDDGEQQSGEGDAAGQGLLGAMYADGAGVPQDYVEAHMWANMAAAQSSGETRDHWVNNRDLNTAKMTAEQIAEAQRRAREWTPTPEP